MVATYTTRDVELAARHLYDAEVALHIAHQTRVDAWISAAADRLHDALVAHAALEAAVLALANQPAA
jgi:hypothetical protein